LPESTFQGSKIRENEVSKEKPQLFSLSEHFTQSGAAEAIAKKLTAIRRRQSQSTTE